MNFSSQLVEWRKTWRPNGCAKPLAGFNIPSNTTLCPIGPFYIQNRIISDFFEFVSRIVFLLKMNNPRSNSVSEHHWRKTWPE